MNKILVEVSARHVHVTEEALEALFGKGAELTKKKDREFDSTISKKHLESLITG